MSPLHQSAPHAAAALHLTGAARYVDDLPVPPGLLYGLAVVSPHARAVITHRDAQAARALTGVHAVLFASDIPGDGKVGPIVHDEEILVSQVVECIGQPVCVVFAESLEICRAAAALVQIEYETVPALLSIDDAEDLDSWLGTPHIIARGDVASALKASAIQVGGTLYTPAQDHFYLETHASLALMEDDGSIKLYCSTQHPTEIQSMVARVLGLGAQQVSCEVPRLGGGFGGKESQATQWACLAALGAFYTKRPVKVRLDREQDMSWTGRRHPFRAQYRAGFDENGLFQAFEVFLVCDGGFSVDLSPAILDRALYHLDNAYFIPHLRFEGRAACTNLASNTAFRGFGGPQGMLVVEQAIEQAAQRLGLDPAEIRYRNYYRPGKDETPYGERVQDPRSERMHQQLVSQADYTTRRAAIQQFNAKSRWIKRGIGLQPVKFGISFTNAPLNQAGALILLYGDGTLQLNHGGTEMGQGLHTKVRAVCADILGLSPKNIRVMPTSTEKVPNTSATAASAGTDLNGAAVRDACQQLRQRLADIAAPRLGCTPDTLIFADDRVQSPNGQSLSLKEVAGLAWAAQISLSATGYYRTPGIHYDRAAGRGNPFYYYAFGVAIVEVELHGLTGEHRVRRIDILHDVGDSLNPDIDKGQIEGGFVQGLGWLTTEEVRINDEGRVLSRGPSTYKIPANGDIPAAFHVNLLQEATQPGTIGGSKAVGEPPLMLAIGVISALRQAVGALGGDADHLHLPASPQALLWAINMRAR